MGRSRIVLADGHDWNRGARGELFGGRSPLMHGAGRERGGRHMGSCRRGLQAYGLAVLVERVWPVKENGFQKLINCFPFNAA
jgi:hypothetical protein